MWNVVYVENMPMVMRWAIGTCVLVYAGEMLKQDSICLA